MSNNRSKRLLKLALNPEKTTEFADCPIQLEGKNEDSVIADVSVTEHGVLSPSPVPTGAENIDKDMADVWEDVFGVPTTTEEETAATAGNKNEFKNTPVPHFALDDAQLRAAESIDPVNLKSTSELDAPVSVSEISPFMFDAPESFENSPAISIGDGPLSISTTNFEVNPSTSVQTPMLSTVLGSVTSPMPSLAQTPLSSPSSYVLTPMPSPVNTHTVTKCNDVFCARHDANTHWATSPTACSSNETNCNEPQIKKSRKRTRHPTEWSDAKRKCLTNIGQNYMSKRGKPIECKVLGQPCKCRNNCVTKITHDERYKCFEKFWKLGSREKQWEFVVRYTKKDKKNRCLNRDVPNNRKYTFKYSLPLPVKAGKLESQVVDVCKVMFLSTLSVSGRIVGTAWTKYDGSTIMETDQRGRHRNHKRVIKAEIVKSVCEHVRSFVPVESHYIRKSSKKLYFDSSLSFARMFKLYEEWFDSEKYESQAKTVRQYRDIVNDNFNLSFFKPKKDQCDVCHTFSNTAHPTNEEKVKQDMHLSNKNIARKLKNEDKIYAIKSNGAVLTAVFDFQKVLTCPQGNVSIFYYKRKLNLLNFTIFDMGKKQAVCYMWDETVAKRGANEVSSSLLDYMKANLMKGVSEFRFWSDNCAGQNKNRFLFYLYIYAATKYNVTITHRFLEKGHTQNEGDSVHALLERTADNKIIYTPDEWYLLVRWAKCTGEPYQVRPMTQKDFYDFKSHVVDKTWSKNTKGEKVSWNNIREVYVNKNEPNKLLYKYDLAKINSETVVIRGNTRRANTSLPTLELAYTSAIGISKDKHKDLISMCDSGIIGAQYADYFKALPILKKDTNECDSDDE